MPFSQHQNTCFGLVRRVLFAIAVLAVFSAMPSAFSQNDEDEIKELKETMKAMQKTIEQQNARINALEKQQGQTSSGASGAKTAATSATPSKTPGVTAPPQTHATALNPLTPTNAQQAAPRLNNVPMTDAAGFFPVPGTDMEIKFGAIARVDTITDFGNNGNPNWFVPSSIPVPGQPGEGTGVRSTVEAKATKLSFEIRKPVDGDDILRLYSEYDFFNDSDTTSMSFRVRHFYAQANNFLVGHTYSAFMDPDVYPSVIDYEGPNALLYTRHAQIRYTLPVYHEGATQVKVFASAELPDSQVSTGTAAFIPGGGSSVNRLPDGVLGARWEGTAGHVQVAGLLRELSFDPGNGHRDNTTGWGATVSGGLNVFAKDSVTGQVSYGRGMARYVNDLGGLGLDAAYDGQRLTAIPVFATTAAYTHQWNDQWRSTVSGGYLHVSAPSSLDPFTVDSTVYATANIVWQPYSYFRVGLEYLYGRKETLNGAERDAQRIDLMFSYDLLHY